MSHKYAPQSGDAKLTRGPVTIDKVSTEQGVLTVTGWLPTPCHELRMQIPQTASEDGVMRIEAWSVTDPDRMCAQALQPFTAEVPMQRPGKFAVNGTVY
jgi:hypothetical protein